jgi:hypothetical protein
MSLHPGTDRYNPAGNSDFTRKAEALALGIANWSTPKATDGAKGGPGQSYGSDGMPPLPAQAAQWQTPVADDQMDRLRGKINSRGEPKLSAQALQWPTPAAQNWKGSSPASVTRADGKSRMDILHYRAEQGFTRPAPAIMQDGRRSSPHAPISRPLWASMSTAAAEPALRRMADGLAHRARALRLLGNGVHPLAAAHAWRSLAAARGLRPVDLAAERRAGKPSADDSL